MEEANIMTPVSLEERGIMTTYEIQKNIDNLTCHSDEYSHDALRRYLFEESNEEMRLYATSAMEEIEFNYYWPETPEERRDFLLARLIAKKYEEMFRAIKFKDRKKLALEEEVLNQEVSSRLSPSSEKVLPGDEYQSLHFDIVELLQNEIQDAEDDILSIRNWINQALDMITISKYKHVPKSVFAQVRLGGDEFEWEEDENDEGTDEFKN